MMPSRL